MSDDRCTQEVLTVAELATILGVSGQTIYRLAAAGEIPKIKLGRAIRFHRSDVLNALRERSTAPATPLENQPDVDPWAQSAASRRKRRRA
ncbi:helix-turn-helix domain-containing protein [uncultured Microbacterium sp.]|uniref:helix-turn-helix domain-containing protein n=1 Tax=uncultured Microbacterium sp. TaxID=191216 RepID=UPI002590B2D3|nr:helix-turn-helix domain-containing protein [uncultured Microbacterium sp.]